MPLAHFATKSNGMVTPVACTSVPSNPNLHDRQALLRKLFTKKALKRDDMHDVLASLRVRALERPCGGCRIWDVVFQFRDVARREAGRQHGGFAQPGRCWRSRRGPRGRGFGDRWALQNSPHEQCCGSQ